MIDHLIAHEVTVAPGLDLKPEETLDGVCRGEVLLIQRRAGYRFSIDAMLLAAFAGSPRGKIADLGTGCAVIPLLLAARGARSVVGIELQESLSDLAMRNVALNRRQEQVNIVRHDFRRLKGVLPANSFDLVLSNPPYFPTRAGFVNPDSEKAMARHEIACSPCELAHAARYLLRAGGALKVIFPAARLVELLAALTAAELEPKRMRLVHPIPTRPAKMVLLEAIKGAGTILDVMAPLYLFDENGAYSDEVKKILGES